MIGFGAGYGAGLGTGLGLSHSSNDDNILGLILLLFLIFLIIGCFIKDKYFPPSSKPGITLNDLSKVTNSILNITKGEEHAN